MIHREGLHRWKYSAPIISADPVAVDTLGLEVINKKRTEIKLDTFKVKYLKLAAGEGWEKMFLMLLR